MQSNQKTDDSTTSAHVQGVSATSGGLIKATLGAALVAGTILTLVWLPAEHGIDPSGVGHILGLTEMGHIKEQLHIEANANAANAKLEETALQTPSNANITQQLNAIQTQLTAIAKTVGANSPIDNAQPPASADKVNTTQTSESWLHENDYTLAPDQGIEVKLIMDDGAVAEFEWSANGSVVNHDTHGDGLGKSISYKQGRSVPGESGQLIAAFDGNHGWFWQNRTEKDVMITLRTRGDYNGVIPP